MAHEQIYPHREARIIPCLSQQLEENWSSEYKMTSDPRGYCLLINNNDFNEGPTKDDLMESRDGSLIDAARFESLFTQLGYTVFRHRNLKASEIQSVVKTFSQKEEHTDVDSTVVIIMSHGTTGDKCYGSDGEHVNYNNIIEMFNNKDCPSLKGKPKMFFIQSCRGEKWDIAPTNPKLRRDSHAISSDEQHEDNKLPHISDVLIAFSTMPGYVSYRDSQRGAWFVGYIVKIFLSHAHKENVTKLMKMVAHQLTSHETDCGGKQGSETILRSWRKDLLFYPEEKFANRL